MSKPNIYPIHLNPFDYGTYVQSPGLVESVWRRTKPTDLTWYAVAGDLYHDRLDIRVHTMYSNVSGGVGRVIHKTTAKLDTLTPTEMAEVDSLVRRAQIRYATQELDRRAEAEHQRQVEALADELFGES